MSPKATAILFILTFALYALSMLVTVYMGSTLQAKVLGAYILLTFGFILTMIGMGMSLMMSYTSEGKK